MCDTVWKLTTCDTAMRENPDNVNTEKYATAIFPRITLSALATSFEIQLWSPVLTGSKKHRGAEYKFNNNTICALLLGPISRRTVNSREQEVHTETIEGDVQSYIFRVLYRSLV